jgi:hypothetical protein
MLDTIKKLAIVVTIAILFSVLTFSIAELAIEKPEYNDYCSFVSKPRVVEVANNCPSDSIDDDFIQQCQGDGGIVKYEYNNLGCAVGASCDTCGIEYEDADARFRLISFIITSVLGLIAILVCLHLYPKNEILEWVYSGFTIGGLASIFIGTISYFSDMNKFIRPLIMIAEIALVIWVALKVKQRQEQPKKKSSSKKAKAKRR